MKMRCLSLSAAIAALMCLSACASLERFSRTNSEHVLQSKYATVDENTANFWPFYISSGKYHSIFWPLLDWDDHGFALRPLVNVEDDDCSILWPLMAWDHNRKNGWCGLGYWNVKKGYYGLFPLFHYDPRPRELKYMGPFWWQNGKRMQFGLFPLIWSLDGNFMCLPLCCADENGFYSIPFSRYRKEFKWDLEKDVKYGWYPWTAVSRNFGGSSRHPLGLDGLYRKTEREWYYAFLFYGGRNKLRVVDSTHPDFKLYGNTLSYEYLRYLWLRSGNKGKHTEDFYRKILLKLENEMAQDDMEKWFGILPLFHYESFRTNWQLVFFGGLLGNMRRTPWEYHNSFLTFLFNQTDRYMDDEDEVDRGTEKNLLATPLVIRNEKQYRKMTPEQKLYFGNIDEHKLRNRLTLLEPKKIAQWEKEFAALDKRSPVSAEIKVKGVSRPIFRTKSLPVPKTETEVESLLKQLKDPAKYIPVTEKFSLYGPYMRMETQEGKALSHKDLLLFGLLSYYGVKDDSTFFHILGPFGYLSDHKFIPGEYEHERKDKKFRMSLLGYWGAEESWRRTAEWHKQFGGLKDQNTLRHRIALTDKKEIAEWEKINTVNIAADTPESTVKVPENLAEAKALLTEMNKTQYHEKVTEKYSGIVPLFHYRTGTDGYLFHILLGLPTAAGKDREGEFLHILGPLGYLYREKHQAPGSHKRDAFQEKTRASLLTFFHDEWHYKPADAYRKRYDFLMENRWRLLRRLRLVKADEIARWEHEFRCAAWFADPAAPVKIPASVEEVRAWLAELDDLKNYRKAEQYGFGFFPIFARENGTEKQTFNLLKILINQEKDRDGNSQFSILAPIGYRQWQKKDESGFQAFLAYSKEKREKTEDADPELAFFRDDLKNRIELYPQTEQALKKWRLNFERKRWLHDPRSNVPVPETDAEVKAMYLKSAQKKEGIGKEWGVFPFYTHKKDSAGTQKDKVLLGLLSAYGKEKNESFFHILGPFGYLNTQKTKKGNFPVDTKKKDFWMSLLFYRFADEKFVANDQYKAAFGENQNQGKYFGDTIYSEAENAVWDAIYDHYRHELLPGKQRKVDFAERINRATFRLDGTYPFKAPENLSEAQKLYLDMHEEKYYDKDIYSGFGVFPFFHYGSNGKDRLNFNIPILLSWHGKKNSGSKTAVLLGLIYADKSQKKQNLQQVERVHDLPWNHNIWNPQDVEKFIDGELELDEKCYDWETRRILLVAARTTGKVTVWKKNTPETIKKEFKTLYALRNDWRSSWDKNFTPAQAIRLKKIICDHTETVDVYERGNLGKILLRYASFGKDRAAMWLGGGLLAKYDRSGVNEETSVLGFLYRSSKNAEGTTRVYFPFIRHHTGKTKSSFSFLGPFLEFNHDRTKNDFSGRILFIPFD